MKTIVACVLTLLLSTGVQAQYHKMAKSSTINIAGYKDYLHAGWNKQLSNRMHIGISAFYFHDETSLIKTNNWVANLEVGRWFIRLGNAYAGANGGFLVMRSNAESAAGLTANDFALGLDLGGELEYYVQWWLIAYGEIKQIWYFGSDYFTSKFVGGGGIKFVLW